MASESDVAMGSFSVSRFVPFASSGISSCACSLGGATSEAAPVVVVMIDPSHSEKYCLTASREEFEVRAVSVTAGRCEDTRSSEKEPSGAV